MDGKQVLAFEDYTVTDNEYQRKGIRYYGINMAPEQLLRATSRESDEADFDER